MKIAIFNQKQIIICLFMTIAQIAVGQQSSGHCDSCENKGPYPFMECHYKNSADTGAQLYRLYCAYNPYSVFDTVYGTPCTPLKRNSITSWCYANTNLTEWSDFDYAHVVAWNDSTGEFGDTLVPVWQTATVIDFGYPSVSVPNDVQYSFNQWLGLCNWQATTDGECCMYVEEVSDANSFLEDIAGDTTDLTNTYAATTGLYPDANCNLPCSFNSSIFVNCTDEFFYSQPNVSYPTYIPYAGGALPDLANYDSNGILIGYTANVWSLRTVLEHEIGHWLGFPPEEWENTNNQHCPPTTGDVMAGYDSSYITNRNPEQLSSYDECWFELLYCCPDATGIKEQDSNGLPDNQFLVLTNAPNPFTDATTINYQVSGSGHVTLRVYNSIGESVATLQNANIDAGSYTAAFDGTGMAKGVYYYVLTEGKSAAVRGMILVK